MADDFRGGVVVFLIFQNNNPLGMFPADDGIFFPLEFIIFENDIGRKEFRRSSEIFDSVHDERKGYRPQGVHHESSLEIGNDRSGRAFVHTDDFIGVDADNEVFAKSAAANEETEMLEMNQVKTTRSQTNTFFICSNAGKKTLDHSDRIGVV